MLCLQKASTLKLDPLHLLGSILMIFSLATLLPFLSLNAAIYDVCNIGQKLLTIAENCRFNIYPRYIGYRIAKDSNSCPYILMVLRFFDEVKNVE
jgi:hypothetical protein